MKKIFALLALLVTSFVPVTAEAQQGCQNYYNGSTFLGCVKNWKADGSTITCTIASGTVTCSSSGGGGGPVTMGGDVTGPSNFATVVALQGTAIIDLTFGQPPTINQALIWVPGNSDWEPQNIVNSLNAASGITLGATTGVNISVGIDFTVNATWTGPQTFNGLAATAGTQLQNSPQHILQGHYWNGASSSNFFTYLRTVPTATTPTGYFDIDVNGTPPGGGTEFRFYLDASESFADGASAAVSDAGRGALRYNNTTKAFQFSADTGAWTSFSALSASIAAGQIVYATSTTAIASSSSFTWDNTNSRFKIGTAGSTTYTAQIVGTNANNDLTNIENTDNTKYSSVAFSDSSGTGQVAIGWGNASVVDTTARSKWNFFQGTNDVLFNRGSSNLSLYLKGSNGFVGVLNASPGFALDVTGSVNTSSNFMGAQSSTSQAASNIGACRFNTSNHWECSENNGSYFQVILSTTTSDITWSAAAHNLNMTAAATDTAGNNFTITPGSAGTVSAATGKAPGILTLQGIVGVAGTAGQIAGAGGDVAITSGGGGTNGGAGGAISGNITMTIGTATGAAANGSVKITGPNVAALGPLQIIGNTVSNTGPALSLNAALNNGGRTYSIYSAGSSNGCGTGVLCFYDVTASAPRWGINSVGNFGNLGAHGNGGALTVNTTIASPPAGLYVIGGNFETDTIPTPGIPTLIVNGTPGVSTCTYHLINLDRNGNKTLAGAQQSTATCNATLSGGNFVQIQVAASTNKAAYQVQIIRDAGGGLSTGLIATVFGDVTTNTNDTGLTASANTDPVYNATGDIVLGGANSNGSILVAKTVSKGSTPGNTPGVGAGTGPTITITGNDQAGTLSVLTGTLPTASSAIVTVVYNAQYTAAPQSIILFPTNANAAALGGATAEYISTNAQTGWTVTGTLAGTLTYTWNYHVIW